MAAATALAAAPATPQTPTPTDPESPEATLSDLADPDVPPDAEASIPKPPAGILPVAEVTRLSYAPSDRPRVRFIGETLVVVTAQGAVEGHDATTGDFRFKLGLPGESLFGAIEVGGEILLSTASGKLLRIDPEHGTLLAELTLPFPLALPPLASAENGTLFFATPDGDVAGYAMDEIEGEPRFRVRTTERVAALAAGNGVVIVSGAERTLSAIDARTGNPLWHFTGRGGFSPAALRADGKRVFVGDDAGEFYSLEVSNGNVDFRWSTGASVRSAPLVDEKSVYVATLGNYVYAYNAGGGAERWRAPLPGRPGLGPTRIHEQLLVPTLDGVLMEVDIKTGRLGKSHGLPSELGSAPAFHVVPPPEGYFEMLEEMRKAAAEKAAQKTAARAATPTAPTDPAATLPNPETESGEPATAIETETEIEIEPRIPPAPATPENAETPTEEALPEEDLPAAPAPAPEWFELSRIAVPLRTGEVLLLRHQVPAPAPAPATGAPPGDAVPGVPGEDTTVPNRSPSAPQKPL